MAGDTQGNELVDQVPSSREQPQMSKFSALTRRVRVALLATVGLVTLLGTATGVLRYRAKAKSDTPPS
ncbi:hypothetical protein Ssi02_09410 [Sinosporangium siamense]|uniref:Uncharacterized protein n=1 Tax=Sinosporangium siamense TaxID=1367973 RepID=A0A919RDE4_9ACTN|nr:hypothetical protein Ssi02_09410 [Sinosporangium siamense]